MQVYSMFLEGNRLFEQSIEEFVRKPSENTYLAVLDVLRMRMNQDGQLLVAVGETGENGLAEWRTVNCDGRTAFVAFTNLTEADKSGASDFAGEYIEYLLREAASHADGIVVNNWGKSFFLASNIIDLVLAANETDIYPRCIVTTMTPLREEAKLEVPAPAAGKAALQPGFYGAALDRAMAKKMHRVAFPSGYVSGLAAEDEAAAAVSEIYEWQNGHPDYPFVAEIVCDSELTRTVYETTSRIMNARRFSELYKED
jgi:hypothetical protein